MEEFLPSWSSSGNHLHVVIMSFIERWRICIVCWHSCILSHTHTCTISEESGWAKVLWQTTATRATSAHLYGNEYFCWSFVRMINARYVSAHAVTSVLGDAQMARDVCVGRLDGLFCSTCWHGLQSYATRISIKRKIIGDVKDNRLGNSIGDPSLISYSFIPVLNRIQSMQRLSVIPISQYSRVQCVGLCTEKVWRREDGERGWEMKEGREARLI